LECENTGSPGSHFAASGKTGYGHSNSGTGKAEIAAIGMGFATYPIGYVFERKGQLKKVADYAW
jgi:hypothetical protein